MEVNDRAMTSSIVGVGSVYFSTYKLPIASQLKKMKPKKKKLCMTCFNVRSSFCCMLIWAINGNYMVACRK